jgi:hypothetical protein
MLKILLVLFFIIGPSFASAYDANENFYRAYNLCTSAAQKKTIKECNYPRMVEGYYMNCMQENGYGESSMINGKEDYANYLKIHNLCSNIANNNAQKKCNYSVRYNKYYNKCIVGNGFNSDGEQIKEPPYEGGIIEKFFESIL